jgi:hypothetical protein
MLRVLDALKARFSERSEHIGVDCARAYGTANVRGMNERSAEWKGDMINAMMRKKGDFCLFGNQWSFELS